MHPRGDTSFEAGGSMWRLRFGTNALATLEEMTGKSINEIFASLEGDNLRIRFFRTVVRVALSAHHPDLTDERVGDLIDDYGIKQMAELLGRAVRAAFPDAVAGEAVAGTEGSTGSPG